MNGIALELKAVRKNFGDTPVVRGLDLRVEAGECLALIGPNGAGKSTVFNLIAGALAPDSGDIFLHGARIAGMKPFRISRRGLSRSFQVTSIFHRLSVIDNLRCALLQPLGFGYSIRHRMARLKEVEEAAHSMLERIGLAARADCEAGVLSYAEQRALDLGMAFCGKASVILLDEPTAGMSRSESDAAARLIADLAKGKTLLLVEHDMQVAFGLADRIAVLAQGELIACGSAEEVRADAKVRAAYLGNEAVE
jgi:branched-chain amino acid transport system ATP-binding protein